MAELISSNNYTVEFLELSIYINTRLYNQPIEIVTYHPIFLFKLSASCFFFLA